MTTLLQTLDQFAATVAKLAGTVAAASDAQWQPSHTPRPREDTTERASGGHGDPTLAIVVDDHRLALRDDVREAERVLAAAAPYVARIEARLAASLDTWAGDRVL